ASIIASAAKEENANLIILSNSFSGKGIAPRISAKLSAGYANGAIELPTFSGERMDVKITAFSNKAFAIKSINSAIKIIALTPNSFAVQTRDDVAEIVDFSPALGEENFQVIVKEIARATDKI